MATTQIQESSELVFSDDPALNQYYKKIYEAMMTPLHHITEIKDNNSLYLGNKEGAGSLWNPGTHKEEEIQGAKDNLKSLNIKAIVCCRDMEPAFPNDFKYLVIPMDKDEPIEVDISEKLNKAYEFILENSKEGSVLVHCRNGCTRSASVVVFFVMKYFGVDYKTAVKTVAEKRACIDTEVFKSRIIAAAEKV